MASRPTLDTVRGWRHSDVKFLVVFAGLCGWSWTQSDNGGGFLHSPGGGAQITIPSNTGLQSNVFRSWLSRIVRHTTVTPSAFTVYDLIQNLKVERTHAKIVYEVLGIEPPKAVPPKSAPTDDPDQQSDDGKDDEGGHEHVPTVPATPAVEPQEGRYRVWVNGGTILTADDLEELLEVAPEALTEKSGPVKVIDSTDGHTVATFRNKGNGVERLMPFVVRSPGRGKRVYQSPAILERTWADGHVDYVCSYPGCPYESDKYMSIGAHYRRHAMDERVARGEPKTKPRTRPAPPPMTQSLAEISDELRLAAAFTAAEMVDAAPPHGIERPDSPGPRGYEESYPYEPRDLSGEPKLEVDDTATAESVVQAISDLIFPGLMERVTQLAADRDHWQRRAVEAEYRLAQFKELLR